MFCCVLLLSPSQEAAHAFQQLPLLWSSRSSTIRAIDIARDYGAIRYPTTSRLPNSILDAESDSISQNNDDDNSAGSSSGSSDPTRKLRYDVERYRNRSRVLESALQHKLNALHLSDQKLLVLQDAAKRVVRRREAAALADAAAVTSNNNKPVHDAAEVEAEWLAKLERVEAARREAVTQLQDAARQHEQWQRDADASANATRRDLAIAQSASEARQSADARDRAAWMAERRELERNLARERDLHQAAVAGIEPRQRLAEHAAAELAAAHAQVETLQSALRREGWRNSNLKAKFRALVETKESLQSKVDTLLRENKAALAATGQQQQQLGAEPALLTARQQQQREYEERMEIAQSAVAAAVKREEAVQRNYKDLQKNYEQVLQEKRALEQQLAEQQPSTRAFVDRARVQSSEEVQPVLPNELNPVLPKAEGVRPVETAVELASDEVLAVPVQISATEVQQVDGAPLELQEEVTTLAIASKDAVQEIKQSSGAPVTDVKSLELQEEVTTVPLASNVVVDQEAMQMSTTSAAVRRDEKDDTIAPNKRFQKTEKGTNSNPASTSASPDATVTPPPRKSMQRRLRGFLASLRPGRIGDYLQQHHLTFEVDDNDPSSSRWSRLAKRLLPRIPFRIARKPKVDEK